MRLLCAFLLGFSFLFPGCTCISDVITVIIRPSEDIFTWPRDVDAASVQEAFVVNGDPDQTWDEKTDPVIIVENNRLLSFYRKVYSKTSSLVVFLDLHHQHCPIDLFQRRVLAYVTTSMSTSVEQSCPELSDVISGAAVPVVVWSFDLSTFMSQFLMSWQNNTGQASYALLFDKSGREHFLAGNNTLAGNVFVFESTFPVYNCSDPAHVVKTAATTDIRDIVMIATSKCVSEMLGVVSLLRLPYTRFRWLLYPTDAPASPGLMLCKGFEDFCDKIKPLQLVERGKPQHRPIDLEGKLLRLADRALDVFTEARETQGHRHNCSISCSTDCSGCQRLFQERLDQISGQDFELFPTTERDEERENIVFDLYRIASTGHVQVGYWSAAKGLSLKQAAYPENFTDTRLTVVVVVEPPFVFKNTSDPKKVTFYGYSIDVLKAIAEKVGFEYNFAECSSGGYGLLEDGQWSGCIGNIVRGEADVILGALTVTVERDKVIDFTLPYYDFAGIQIMMKREDSSTQLFYYASVFTTPAWLSIFAVLAVTSVLLWAFERITQQRPTVPAPVEHLPSQEVLKQQQVVLPTIAESVPQFVSSSRHPDNNLRASRRRKDESKPHLSETPATPEAADSKANSEVTGEEKHCDDADIDISPGRRNCNNNNNKNSSSTTDLIDTEKDTEDSKESPGLRKARASSGQWTPGSKSDSHYSIGDSIWFVVGALTMAGGGDPPRSLAGRVLVAGFWFFTVIMMSTFTANLAAFLTVSRLGATISSLDDLAAQNEINYSTVKDTSVMEYFKRMATIESNFYEDWKRMSLQAENSDQESRAVWDYPLGNKYNAIWKSIKRAGLIGTNQEGLARVLAGEFALVTESPVIRYYTSLHCSLQAVGEQFSTRPYAIGLKDKFPYTDQFSQAILDLQKDRVLGELQFKWWSGNSECTTESTDAGLGLYLLSGTFIVAGAGLALGVLTLGLEHVIVKARRSKT